MYTQCITTTSLFNRDIMSPLKISRIEKIKKKKTVYRQKLTHHLKIQTQCL